MSQMKEKAQSTNFAPKAVTDNAPQATLSKASVLEAPMAGQGPNVTDAEEAIDTAIKLIRVSFDYAIWISDKLHGRMKCNFLREIVRGFEVALDEINDSL